MKQRKFLQFAGYREPAVRETTFTDGSSADKTPSAVKRPVRSIWRRSYTLTGETVAVPTDFTFTFCGIIDPVTKTYLFPNCELGGSANATAAKPVAESNISAMPFNSFDDLMGHSTAICFDFNCRRKGRCSTRRIASSPRCRLPILQMR